MGIIKEFTQDQFWDAEDFYLKMIDVMKERSRELAMEFGKVDKNWFAANIELVIIDDEMEVLVNATLIKNKSKIEKANGTQEEKINFQFPMDWLFYDDYQEKLKEIKNATQEESDREYAEYLRLKEKFKDR